MELQRLVMEDALETPLSEDMSPQEVCGRSRQGSVCVNPAEEEVRSLSGRSLASEDSDASSVVYHKSLRGVAAGVGGDGVDRDGSESSEKDVGESGEKDIDEKGGVKDIDEKGGVKDIESGEKDIDEKGSEKDIDEKGGVKDIESGEKVTDKNVGEKDIGENDKENTNEKNTNPTDNNDKDKYTDNNNNSDNNPTTSMEPKEEDIPTKSSPPHDETPAIPIDFTEDFTTLFHSRSSQSLQTKPAETNSTETKTEIGDEKKAVSMSARILGVLGRKTEEDKKKKQKKKREGEEIAQEAKEEASVEETQEMDGGGKKKWEIDQRKSGEIVRSRCDGSDEADAEFAEAGKQQESSCWEGGGSY